MTWLEIQISRLNHGTDRSKHWNDKVLAHGLSVALNRPDVIADRYADLMQSEPDKYVTVAMGRVSDAMSFLLNEDVLFAVVCLNSVGLWSRHLDRVMPACDLVINGKGGTGLAKELARVMVTFAQLDKPMPKGRPARGVLEEIRDLGIAAMSFEGDFKDDVDRLAVWLKYSDARQIRRMRKVWQHVRI